MVLLTDLFKTQEKTVIFNDETRLLETQHQVWSIERLRETISKSRHVPPAALWHVTSPS